MYNAIESCAVKRCCKTHLIQPQWNVTHNSPLVEVILCVVQPQTNRYGIALSALCKDIVHHCCCARPLLGYTGSFEGRYVVGLEEVRRRRQIARRIQEGSGDHPSQVQSSLGHPQENLTGALKPHKHWIQIRSLENVSKSLYSVCVYKINKWQFNTSLSWNHTLLWQSINTEPGNQSKPFSEQYYRLKMTGGV